MEDGKSRIDATFSIFHFLSFLLARNPAPCPPCPPWFNLSFDARVKKPRRGRASAVAIGVALDRSAVCARHAGKFTFVGSRQVDLLAGLDLVRIQARVGLDDLLHGR